MIVSAGRRSRKTLIGDRKVLVDQDRGALWQSEPYKYFLAAPTHQQAKAVFWERLKSDTRTLRSKTPRESDLSIELYNECIIQVVGLDKPERIEGQTSPPIKGIHITEMGNTKPGLWEANIRPILSDTNGFAIIDGVPEGRNHYYDLALYASGGVIPVTIPMEGGYAVNELDPDWSFHTWFSSDILPEAEIIAAKRQLDEKTFRQEYEGSFETEEGLAYYAWNRQNYKVFGYDPKCNLDIGMDFNVNPMCSVEGHILGDKYFQFGESILRNSNTYEMAQHLIHKYNLKKDEYGKLSATIYPDSTGASRESNARMTDLDILRKAGFTVKARKSNPRQRDRINSVNSLMRPTTGEPRYYADPEKCPHTIDDFNKVQRTADGRLDKNQEEEGKSRVHVSDALGYLINYNFPVKEPEKWSF